MNEAFFFDCGRGQVVQPAWVPVWRCRECFTSGVDGCAMS